MSKKEKKKFSLLEQDEAIVLDIPEDEIWTYQVPGLAAPHVNKPYKHAGIKKVVLALIIVVAVSLSMYFSVRTVQKDTFEYTPNEVGFELEKFSNTGYITELDIDYVSSVVYDENNPDVSTNFTIKKDETKKITSVREYALNCDEKVKVINIGADVLSIDGKSFYSCWALQRIEVDENNPNYCDVDGVLYNKDKTEIICYPCDHDQYLRDKNGYTEEIWEDNENFAQYEKDVLTYVVPSTVEKIGQLCFNYANMTTVYLPEGLKSIETLGFFEILRLANIYSYKADDVTDTALTDVALLGEVYLSLPEGLEFIGSDAFSYNQAMTYVYIPASVTEIGHHAFWDTCYKQDKQVMGVAQIYVAADEDTFKSSVDTGDEWRPQYDFLLFKKSVDVIYSSERQPMK